MQLKRVVVTGIGAITPLGNNLNDDWNGLINGVSVADMSTNFDASTIMKLGATIMGKPYSKNDLLKAIEWQMNNKK